MKSRSTDTDTGQSAYLMALKLLTARDHTVAGIRRKLQTKGFSSGAVDEALDRLQQERLLDDRRFAEHFTEQALESHRFAGQRLCQELRRRGVSGDVVAAVTAAGRETHDESEGVAALLERRFPAFRWQASDEREKRRIISFLQRRGYGMGAILQVMRSTT